MNEYDYSKQKYQQEDALPEGALTSVKKGQHVYIPWVYFGEGYPQRFECLTGGKFAPNVTQVHMESGERKRFTPTEKKVIKAGGKDQYGRGNEFYFATEEECQRHIDRLLGKEYKPFNVRVDELLDGVKS